MESNKVGLHTFIIGKEYNAQNLKACSLVCCTSKPGMKTSHYWYQKRLCTIVCIYICIYMHAWSKMWLAHKNVENDTSGKTIYKMIIFSIYSIQLHLCWIRVWLLRMNFQNMLFPFLFLWGIGELFLWIFMSSSFHIAKSWAITKLWCGRCLGRRKC